MEWVTKAILFFNRGGAWMWVILAVQLATIALIIERAYFLYVKRKRHAMAFVSPMEDLIKRGQLDVVVAQSQNQDVPMAKVSLAGVMAAMNLGGKDEIQGKMDEILMAEMATLEKRTSFLPMLGNVATLTGLLGTITGMINAFVAVSFASPAEKAALLSAGISEAMNTTAYGLIVAIPALIMYAVLQNRTEQLAQDLKQASLKMYNWLSFAYEPIALRTSRQKKDQKDREAHA